MPLEIAMEREHRRHGSLCRPLIALGLSLTWMVPPALRALEPSVVIVSDPAGEEHASRRETRIEVSPGADGKLSYNIKQEVFPLESISYSKEGVNAYLPPVVVGGVSVYPSAFSIKFKDDEVGQNEKLVRMISFDEKVDILLEGELVNTLLPVPTGPRKVAEVKLSLSPRRPTSAWLGALAQPLVQRAAPSGTPATAPAATLSNGRQIFRGNLVTLVEQGGPAAAAGIKVGDVVVALAGEKLTRGRQFEMVGDFLEPGMSVPCEVVRRAGKDLQVLDLTITPGRRKP